MHEFIIEDSVPLPKPRQRGLADALRALKPGQSIWVDRGQNNVASQANVIRKETGAEFITRSEKKDDVRGTRVWRTA